VNASRGHPHVPHSSQVVVRPYTPKVQTILLAHMDAQMAEVRRLNAVAGLMVMRRGQEAPARAPVGLISGLPLPPRPAGGLARDDGLARDGLPVLPESLY
jgi:hypothetical protein